MLTVESGCGLSRRRVTGREKGSSEARQRVGERVREGKKRERGGEESKKWDCRDGGKKKRKNGKAKAGREWVVGTEKEQARVWLFSWGWGLLVGKTGT